MFAINYKMSLLTSLSTFLPSVTGQAEDREVTMQKRDNKIAYAIK